MYSPSSFQELVTDCSFVSSLCIAAAYERKFKRQLITNIIFPQNRYVLGAASACVCVRVGARV